VSLYFHRAVLKVLSPYSVEQKLQCRETSCSDVSLGYSAGERAGSAALRQRRRLPAAGAVAVRRRARRDVAVHAVDGGDAARRARSPADGPPDGALDRPAGRHGGRRRADGPLRGDRVRARSEHDLHQNQRQL